MASTRRLQKELTDIKKAEMKTFRLLDTDILLNWIGLLVPDKEPFRRGAFRLLIEFPAEYPFKPPKITFLTKIYHPNIDEKGQVCLPIIAPESWKPATKTEQDYSKGFKDKNAAGFEYQEPLAKHESQKDYAKGFGGRYGLEADRQDKSAVGFEHRENLAQHESQKDYSKGFGGKHGVESDRQDASAKGWNEPQVEQQNGHSSPQKTQPPGKGRASSLRARFERMSTADADDEADRIKAEQEQRRQEDLRQQEEQKRIEAQRQDKISKEWSEQERLEQEHGPEAYEAHVAQRDAHVVSPRPTSASKRISKTPVGAVSVMPGVRPPSPEPMARSPPLSPNYYEPEPQTPPADVASPPQPTPFVQMQSPQVSQPPPQFGMQYDFPPGEEEEEIGYTEPAAPMPQATMVPAHETDEHPLAQPTHPMADTGHKFDGPGSQVQVLRLRGGARKKCWLIRKLKKLFKRKTPAEQTALAPALGPVPVPAAPVSSVSTARLGPSKPGMMRLEDFDRQYYKLRGRWNTTNKG